MMDGTFKMPDKSADKGADAPASTELQKSIFAGPPVSAPAVAGTKRPREEDEDKSVDEDEDEDEDVEMEVDDDED